MDEPTKEKRQLTQKERDLNERRKAAQAELKEVREKVKWTNVCKFTSRRNKGNAISARNFLQEMNSAKDAAVGVAAANAKANGKPASPAREAVKAEVEKNVAKAVRSVTRKLGQNAQNRRNRAKANLLSVLSPHGKKPTAQSISKLLSLRKAGQNNAAYLAQLNVAAATAVAAVNKTLKKVVQRSPKAKAASPTDFKKIREQVTKNVEQSGMKVNALNRRALAVARQGRPNLSVANFMRNRVPHRRRTKKANVPRNNVNALRIRAPVFRDDLSPVYERSNENQTPSRF